MLQPRASMRLQHAAVVCVGAGPQCTSAESADSAGVLVPFPLLPCELTHDVAWRPVQPPILGATPSQDARQGRSRPHCPQQGATQQCRACGYRWPVPRRVRPRRSPHCSPPGVMKQPRWVPSHDPGHPILPFTPGSHPVLSTPFGPSVRTRPISGAAARAYKRSASLA